MTYDLGQLFYKELVLGFIVYEEKWVSNSKEYMFTDIVPITTSNAREPEDFGIFAGVSEQDPQPGVKRTVKGVLPVQFPTYEVRASVGDSVVSLGYQHPGVKAPDWSRILLFRVEKAISCTASESNEYTMLCAQRDMCQSLKQMEERL